MDVDLLSSALVSPAAVHQDTVDCLLVEVERAWAEVLDIEVVPLDMSFFEAGGDSLLLIILLDRLNSVATDRELEAADLFEHSTVRAQAEMLARPRTTREMTVLGAHDRRQLLGRARRSQSTGSPVINGDPDLPLAAEA